MSEEKKNIAPVKPITITDKESGKVYTLDFDRESVRFAEAHGFDYTKAISGKMPLSAATDLFYFAFKKNHGSVSREAVEKLLFDKMQGLSGELIVRLYELYAQTLNTLIATEYKNDENPLVAVEF